MKRNKQRIAINTEQALDLLAMTFRAMLTIVEQQKQIEEQQKQLAAKAQKQTDVLKPEYPDLSWLDEIFGAKQTDSLQTDQTEEQ
jgi:hypothetical protein